MEIEGVDLLYVAPLRGVSIADICAEKQRLGILSFSGIPSYASEGLSVAFDVQGEGSRLLISLEATRSEDAQFRAALQGMAQIIRRVL